MTRRRQAERGLTLLEVLLTLGIMALLGGLLTGILNATIENQKKAEATLLRERVGSAILDLFARDLAQAYAYGVQGAFLGKDESTALGEADSLTIVTAREPSTWVDDPENQDAATASPRGSALATGDQEVLGDTGRRPFRLSKVTYFLRESRSHPGLLTLFRAEQRFVAAPPTTNTVGARGAFAGQQAFAAAAAEEGKEQVFEVFDRVKSFKLEYISKDENAIKDGWAEEDLIPDAVRVSVEIVPDPIAEQDAVERGRPQRIYRAVVGIETSIPKPPHQGQRPGGGND